MKKGSIIILVIVVAIIFFWGMGSYNGLVTSQENVNTQWANVQNQYQRRADLIPNLVETVKGYAKHEKETLERVISARNAAASATTMEGRVEGENALQSTLKSLFAIAEAYPDLKANTNFLSLQGDLQRIEDEIANSRKYYNAIVKTYNTKREVFPSSIVAGMFHFEKKPLFEVGSEAERENVKVQF